MNYEDSEYRLGDNGAKREVTGTYSTLESGIMLHMFYMHYRCYRLDIKLHQSVIL